MGFVEDLKLGFLGSFLFHLVIATLLMTKFPVLHNNIDPPPQPIPVEILNIDDLTRSKSIETVSSPVDKQKIMLSPKPSSGLSTAASESSQPNFINPIEKKNDYTKSIVPQEKPDHSKKFDSSRISALIDRSIKEMKPNINAVREKELEKKIVSSQGSLDVRRMTATIQDYIRQKMLACWSVPVGAENAENLQIAMTVRLNPAGYLIGNPVFKNSAAVLGGSNHYLRVFAESTARAVRRCEPYDKLPKESYELWKELELNFILADMLG